MSILCILLARSKHSKMGLFPDRARSKLRFDGLPLENQHSRDKRCRKRKAAFFREPATCEDDALMSQRHVTCPGKAGRFQGGGHGETLGGGDTGRRGRWPGGSLWAGINLNRLAVFKGSQALSAGRVWFFTPQGQWSTNLKESK